MFKKLISILAVSAISMVISTNVSAAYNCSELVWKAYKKATSIDLDSNGGLAVYPNNIYNSSHTTILKYW